MENHLGMYFCIFLKNNQSSRIFILVDPPQVKHTLSVRPADNTAGTCHRSYNAEQTPQKNVLMDFLHILTNEYGSVHRYPPLVICKQMLRPSKIILKDEHDGNSGSYTNINLHFARKYAQVFVCGHYPFRAANRYSVT